MIAQCWCDVGVTIDTSVGKGCENIVARYTPNHMQHYNSLVSSLGNQLGQLLPTATQLVEQVYLQ